MKNQIRRTACRTNSGADTRLTFVPVILLILFFPLTAAKAQTGVNYRFLEVVDTAGKPVVKAKVETERSKQETDDNGIVKQFEILSGDFSTRGLKVSKPGYLTYRVTTNCILITIGICCGMKIRDTTLIDRYELSY